MLTKRLLTRDVLLLTGYMLVLTGDIALLNDGTTHLAGGACVLWRAVSCGQVLAAVHLQTVVQISRVHG